MTQHDVSGDLMPDDEELIGRLRGGDSRAYEQLWSAHVSAAQRVAHRYDPHHADDLVSEAFLAVYEQIAVAGKGPQSAFRAYLFTVIRNAAAKRRRLGELNFADPDLELVEIEDGLTLVSEKEDAAYLLSAFNALPPRWQRVLWMSEIERSSRSEIAHALDIRANAVSALLRRARAGLQREWLAGRVPLELREDPSHAGRYLVDYVTGATLAAPRRAVRAHLDECSTCGDLYRELHGDYRRMRKITLAAAGFAALAVTLPVSSPAPAAAAGVSILALLGLGATGGATGIGALIVGGGLVTALLTGIAAPPPSDRAHAEDRVPSPTAAPRPASPSPTPTPSATVDPVPDDTDTPQPTPVVPGRGNTSTEIPTLDADYSFDTVVTPRAQPPKREPLPAPTDDTTTGQTTDGQTTDGQTTPSQSAVVTLASAPPTQTYLTPAFAGTSSDAAAVYVSFDGDVYGADLVAATGRWSFDGSGVILSAASHDYRIWAVNAAGTAGTALSGSFTVLEPEVAGFENTADLQLAEASTTGVVFTARGTPGGLLCVDADSGQQAELTLDANGTVSRRIRFLAGGFYTISFRMCGDGGWGPVTERSLFVDDPSLIFSPFDPPDQAVEFSDPSEG